MFCWRGIVCAFVILTTTNADDEDSNSRLVRTTQGTVRGYRDPEVGIYVFYGIPYATAPKGSKKFKAPLLAPMWLDTLEAVDSGIICPQLSSPWPWAKHGNVQEDCLIANVYVPETEETKLPVIVYVHGGAYQIGFGNMITPKNLVKTKNVIVVTFNYRVGVHGFLCLGTSDAPGNAGLKDQVQALTWVKRNIETFGGNAKDVTIAGYSAGSHSVDLLVLSKSARGLFTKVIAESGASLGPGFVIDPLKTAKDFAISKNFTNVNDVYALEEFYKTTPLEELTQGILQNRPDSSLPFGPCVERDTEGVEFLTEAPLEILKKGRYAKVPMLYGFSNMEGLLIISNFDEWKIKMNEKFSEFLPVDLQFESEEQKEEVAKKVKEFYFGNKIVSDDTVLEYVDYFSDVMFVLPMLRAVKMYAEAGHDQIYLSEYSFVDKDTPVVPHTNIRGASHCSQTLAVLDGKSIYDRNEADITTEFSSMKKIMRDIWVNFIKTGRPVPEISELPTWSAAGANRSPYMKLTLPPELQSELLPRRTHFWDEIYERHYLKPSPPPDPPVRHTEL